MISSGHARGVHHIESPAMCTLSKMCNVRDIDVLVAIVSVIRPGAANEGRKSEFALRAQGLAPAEYAILRWRLAYVRRSGWSPTRSISLKSAKPSRACPREKRTSFVARSLRKTNESLPR